MDDRLITVPVSLLLDPDLQASAKVVWMALRLASSVQATRNASAADRAQLQALTDLSRHTVQEALAQLKLYTPAPVGPWVRMPGALLRERKVGATAKLLYGLLQAAPNCTPFGGKFTYASLCAFTHLSRSTLKLAVTQLTRAGWIRAKQAHRLRPIRFWLGRPDLRHSLAAAKIAQRRLDRSHYTGEAIMQEYLSLLIDSDQFTDNARPGFLVNPLTLERLELDRYYLDGVAFEYHGTQHERATGEITQEEADRQRVRDLIKAGICLYQGIHLVIVREQDLSLQAMQKKVGRLMPLRNLAGQEPLMELLEEASITYRASAEAARRAGK